MFSNKIRAPNTTPEDVPSSKVNIASPTNPNTGSDTPLVLPKVPVGIAYTAETASIQAPITGKSEQTPTKQEGILGRFKNWYGEEHTRVLLNSFKATLVSLPCTMIASQLVRWVGGSNLLASVVSGAASYSWYPAYFAFTYRNEDRHLILNQGGDSIDKHKAKQLTGSYVSQIVLMELIWQSSYIALQNALFKCGLSTAIATGVSHTVLATGMNFLVPIVRDYFHKRFQLKE